MRGVAAVASVFVAVIAIAPVASASSIWDRVIDPTYADRDYAHRFAAEREQEAEELDYEADVATALFQDEETFHRKRALAVLLRDSARDILERFGAATSSDVRLRFDLGQILSHVPQAYAHAREVLLGALKVAPNDPRAASAWFQVAICDAKLEKRDEEAKAYLAALALEDDPAQRALLLGNLAEARMSVGDLDGARDAAETSVQLHPIDLVRYTLGVILDRAGDEYGAIEQVKLATSGVNFLGLLRQPGVFFEPEYELSYYEALGFLAAARSLPPKSSDWMLDFLEALKAFDFYVQHATPGDRWRARAEDHIARIEATLNLKTPKTTK
jgi:tetratricopeptide (TPR) repeat protein